MAFDPQPADSYLSDQSFHAIYKRFSLFPLFFFENPKLSISIFRLLEAIASGSSQSTKNLLISYVLVIFIKNPWYKKVVCPQFSKRGISKIWIRREQISNRNKNKYSKSNKKIGAYLFLFFLLEEPPPLYTYLN